MSPRALAFVLWLRHIWPFKPDGIMLFDLKHETAKSQPS